MKKLVAVLAILTLLGSCAAGTVSEPSAQERRQRLGIDVRVVKAMTVISQPEIFYCGALGQEPDLSGVVFRLEYEDGGVEETGFVPARTVLYLDSESCEVPYYAYGMALPVPHDPNYREPHPGKSEQLVYFDNAETLWTSDWWYLYQNPQYRYPDYRQEEFPYKLWATVDVYNLTIEEFLQKSPAHVLTPERPMRAPMKHHQIAAASFTPEKDGIYLFTFGGDAWNKKVMDGEGTLHELQYNQRCLALRLRMGEEFIFFNEFYSYASAPDNWLDDWGEVTHGTAELSVIPLETRGLRPGEEMNIEGGCVVVPEIPGEGEYRYHFTNVVPLPVEGLGGYLRGIDNDAWEVHMRERDDLAATYRQPVVYNADICRGALYPYNTLKTDYDTLTPANPGLGNVAQFALAAAGENAAASLVPVRETAARGIALRLGESVPFSDVLTCDAPNVACIVDFHGEEDIAVFFAQGGVAMLRGNKPGKAELIIIVNDGFDEPEQYSVTITVTE